MTGKNKRPARRGPPARQEGLDSPNLSSEIGLLRELLHEVMARVEPGEPKEYLRLLDSVGRACGQLARLVRAQDQLSDQESLAEEIGRIADEVRRELSGEVG